MNRTIVTILRAVSLGLGMATLVLNILDQLVVKDAMTLLSLGIVTLAISLLQKNTLS